MKMYKVWLKGRTKEKIHERDDREEGYRFTNFRMREECKKRKVKEMTESKHNYV